MNAIKTIFETTMLINSIYNNTDKIIEVVELTKNWIVKPVLGYVTGCRCIICYEKRKQGLKPVH